MLNNIIPGSKDWTLAFKEPTRAHHVSLTIGRMNDEWDSLVASKSESSPSKEPSSNIKVQLNGRSSILEYHQMG